jgi:hypothetical protein
MNFKKPKQQVLDEIQARAGSAIYSELQNMNMRIDMGSAAYGLQQAIAKAIAEGFKCMMENQYTDQEFESDIGLKP